MEEWAQRVGLPLRGLFLASHHNHGKITQGPLMFGGKAFSSFYTGDHIGNTGASLRLLTALNQHQTVTATYTRTLPSFSAQGHGVFWLWEMLQGSVQGQQL